MSNPVSVGDDLVERLNALIAEEAADHANDAAAAIERGERPDLWEREITIPVATLSEAASKLEAVRAERDAAVALNNKYAWERDKAREERDAAERRSEAHWSPRLDTAEAQLKAAREALEPFANAVFNDNGDMTVNTGAPIYNDFVRAYFTHRAALNPNAPEVDGQKPS